MPFERYLFIPFLRTTSQMVNMKNRLRKTTHEKKTPGLLWLLPTSFLREIQQTKWQKLPHFLKQLKINIIQNKRQSKMLQELMLIIKLTKCYKKQNKQLKIESKRWTLFSICSRTHYCYLGWKIHTFNSKIADNTKICFENAAREKKIAKQIFFSRLLLSLSFKKATWTKTTLLFSLAVRPKHEFCFHEFYFLFQILHQNYW